MYVERGALRLSIVSRRGREAVVAVIEAGRFLGEGCLAGQAKRTTTATTMVPSVIVVVPREAMADRMRTDPTFANRFIDHMLKRNIRTEEDLVDQRFNPSEKRLARTLLLLARCDEPGPYPRPIPGVSQEVLADLVGTTRSRVSYFMNRFRKRGFVEYRSKGTVRVHHALLKAVLED